MNYVIVGGSVAAVGAIEGIRKADRQGSITVVSEESCPGYSRPLISYYLAGKITREGMYYREPDFYARNRVKVVHDRVVRITPEHSAVLSGGQIIPADKLLLAVGGTPLLYDRLARNRDNVLGFYTLEDVEKIKSFLRPGLKVTVIGGGLVGLKATEALHRLGTSLTVVDLATRLMPGTMDLEASLLVERHLRSAGIDFRLGVEVKAVEGNPLADKVVLGSGEELKCDLVIVAAGVTPNVDLARNAGIVTARGIVVDLHQESSMPGIFAAGDVAEAREFLSGENQVVPLLPLALEQGRVAGMNMAGCKTVYRGSLAVNSTSLLGLPVMSAGDSKSEGITAVWSDPPGYRKIVMRNGVLTGLIAVGRVERIGIIADLIRKRTLISGLEAKLLAAEVNGIDIRDIAKGA